MKNKYTYEVSWSDEDGVFISRCLEFPSLAAHGKTEVVALKEIVTLVEDILVDMKKSNETIPEPLSARNYSGVTKECQSLPIKNWQKKQPGKMFLSINFFFIDWGEDERDNWYSYHWVGSPKLQRSL